MSIFELAEDLSRSEPARAPMIADPRVALHVIRSPRHGGNSYCGPGALAAVTGIDTRAAARHIRGVSGLTAIRGLSIVDLYLSLARAGFNVTSHDYPRPSRFHRKRKGLTRPTMRQWIEHTEELRHRHRALVVHVTGHYIAVSGAWWVDNRIRVPQRLRDYPHPRQRVLACLALDLR